MTEQHRRNDEHAPTQSNPPDAPDMYVVVATATKLCTASPLKSEVATLTMLVEAKSDAEAVRELKRWRLASQVTGQKPATPPFRSRTPRSSSPARASSCPILLSSACRKSPACACVLP